MNKTKFAQCLVQVRKQELKCLLEQETVRAHGNVAGMDVFSWTNVDTDTLFSFLSTLPSETIWMGMQEEIVELLNQYPEGVNKLNTLIVYDQGELPENTWKQLEVRNVVCVSGVREALKLMRNLIPEESCLLFTGRGANAGKAQNVFEEELQRLR